MHPIQFPPKSIKIWIIKFLLRFSLNINSFIILKNYNCNSPNSPPNYAWIILMLNIYYKICELFLLSISLPSIFMIWSVSCWNFNYISLYCLVLHYKLLIFVPCLASVQHFLDLCLLIWIWIVVFVWTILLSWSLFNVVWSIATSW